MIPKLRIISFNEEDVRRLNRWAEAVYQTLAGTESVSYELKATDPSTWGSAPVVVRLPAGLRPRRATLFATEIGSQQVYVTGSVGWLDPNKGEIFLNFADIPAGTYDVTVTLEQ